MWLLPAYRRKRGDDIVREEGPDTATTTAPESVAAPTSAAAPVAAAPRAPSSSSSTTSSVWTTIGKRGNGVARFGNDHFGCGGSFVLTQLLLMVVDDNVVVIANVPCVLLCRRTNVLLTGPT
jgi:hypothetical protein